MRGSRKFFRAINLERFVIDINGQSSARQRNAIEMAVCWRDDDAGDPDQYCKETLHFCAFSGGGGVQITCFPPPSGSAHAPQSWFWLTGPMREIYLRGSSFGVSDHVRLESNCSDRRTEKSSIQLYFHWERITEALIRLRRCADRSVPLLFACN